MAENNQYTRTKVQAEDFTSGWGIAFIIAGTGVSLPILYLGAEISLAIGFQQALWAFGLSTLVLTVLCIATTLIGNRSRLSTYMVLHFSFGEKGAKIINGIIGVCLLGWFSVALELLAQAVQDTTMETIGLSIPLWLIIIITSAFITITTIYGIRSIEKLANIAVPILLLFLLYVVYKSYAPSVAVISSIWEYVPSQKDMTLFDATSILIGSSILVPVLMADLSRFIYNDKQSLIAVLGVTIGFPLVLIISGIASLNTGEIDIIQIMKSVDLVLPAFILLFVSTWVTNATNLYSTTLTFSTISSSFSFKQICLVTSVAGTVLSLFGFSEHLFAFLNILGVFMPSISAIYLLDFFWLRRQKYDLDEIPEWGRNGLISWLVSSVITLLTYLEYFHISHAYFVDSFLIGGFIFILLNRKGLRK